MNKLISSIIGGALGLTLATSVGIGMFNGANSETRGVTAAESTTTYVFDSKDWTATSNNKVENWIDVRSGSGFANNGIQITTNSTGASGTTPVRFNSVTRVVLTYNTNKSEGSGSFDVKVGDNNASSVNWSFSGNKKTDGRTARFTKTVTYRRGQTGAVKVTVNTNVNSCYLVSCAITSSGIIEDPHTYTDIITAQTTELNYDQSNYQSWSGKKLTSGAIYSGHSSTRNGAIQLRSAKTTSGDTSIASGIVSTTSGGTVKKVKVIFSNDTEADRTVHVYGSNEAFAAADDLFISNTKGGNKQEVSNNTIHYQGKETSFTVELDNDTSYQYVGIRSADKALYISRIEITWERNSKNSDVTAIQVASNPDKTTYAVGEKFDTHGLAIEIKFSGSNTFERTTNYSLSKADHSVFTNEEINDAYVITVTSLQDETKTTSFVVTVVNAYPVKLTRTTAAIYSPGMKLNEGTGRFTAEYTDENENVTNIKVGDPKTTLVTNTNNPVVLDPNTPAIDYEGRSVKLEYTDHEHTVSYTFTITIREDLVLDHFDNVPDYIIKNETSNLIEARYVSFVGEPEVTFEPMTDSGLTITHDENDDSYDEVSDVGSIYFSVAGSKKGQYSIIVTIRHGSLTSSKSMSILVRDAEEGHEGSGEYTLITSIDDVTTGSYVIAANVNGEYYGLDGTLNNGKYGNTALTVSENSITNKGHVVSITKGEDGYQITSGGKYIEYKDSTNLKEVTTSSDLWTINEVNQNGTFAITSSSNTTRGILYRAGAANLFGGYSTNNIPTNAEYYNIELFKLVGVDEEEEEINEAFELIKNFVDTYMHMGDISITDTSDTGACRGESGYYITAKEGLYELFESYSGDTDELIALFETKFPDAYERYVTWASKNNDSQPFVGNAIAMSSKSTKILDVDSSAIITTLIVTSVLGMTLLASYFYTKKKKDN